MKRLFDIVFSMLMLILLSPFFLLISILILGDSRGGIFFGQTRVGLNGKHFLLHKFRTMKPESEGAGQLTVGARDSRITRIGYHLRKYKVDELPQLWNVFVGEMSMVGPRPEVPRYVRLYNAEQQKVLLVKPGITDYASLRFFTENELLARAEDPERVYIEEIMPAKLALNLKYIEEMNFATDIRIIVATVARMFS